MKVWIEIAINKELNNAQNKFPPFKSPHEGYAILLEEVDELWDEVKKLKPGGDRKKMKEEIIQVATMAIRFLEDLF